MGVLDQNAVPEDWALMLDSNHVHLVLSERELNASDMSDGADGNVSVTLDMLELDAPIPAGMFDGAHIAVVEVSGEVPSSVERIANVRTSYPEMPVIAAMRDSNLSIVRSLLHEGVADVLELPLNPENLTEVINRILSDKKFQTKTDVEPAKIISVIKSIGGVGATTLAVQTANSLAKMGGYERNGVCLFDLDLQFGSAASFLGVGQALDFSDLLVAGSRVDGDLLKSVAAELPSGLNMVPAPADIMPMESVNSDQIYRIIDTAAQEYDLLVLDLPGNWSNWSVSLVARSDIVLLVVELTIASLRQAKRQLRLLASQGIEGDHIKVVVNRVEKKLFRSINLEDASSAINYPVELSVRSDYPLVSAAHDQGVLIEDIHSKSKISKDIDLLIDDILVTLNGED